MRNLGVSTKLPLEEVKKRAKAFFGPGGLGLKLVDEANDCFTFEGGGGYVRLAFQAGEKGTDLNLVTQEWERQIDEFAAGLV